MEQTMTDLDAAGGIVKFLRGILAEPRLKGVNVDSDDLLTVHRKILLEKTVMQDVFREIYQTCVDEDNKNFSGNGMRVELGAGVSLFKHFHPDIVTTDVKSAPHLDMKVDALNMPFEDNTIRAFYGINCFHHFPKPDLFFNELARTLVPGGGCVLVDPYFGFVASRFFAKVFATECFNPNQKSWDDESSMGVMHGANQALSYIVFTRDKALFAEKYPQLELVKEYPLSNYLRYFLSGGLNFRSLIPTFAAPLIKGIEGLLTPLHRVLGLHHVIVIRKRKV